MNWLTDYFDRQRKLLDQVDARALDTVLNILERARLEGKRIFVFGNGGSASTASHFAADLGKNTVRGDLPRFQVICLNDNLALLSAYGNDMGYDSVFVEPLLSHAAPGDVVLAISASGNSPNIVRAVEQANQLGMTTIGFSGLSGGKLRELAQHPIHVPCSSYEQVEDIHLMLCHALISAIKARQ